MKHFSRSVPFGAGVRVGIDVALEGVSGRGSVGGRWTPSASAGVCQNKFHFTFN